MTEAYDVWSEPLQEVQNGGLARPRIAIAGIGVESSTFSPHRTVYTDFRILRGQDLWTRYPFMPAGHQYRQAAEWFPILRATSLPGGIVDRPTYEALITEITEGLARVCPLDAVWLDLHGAMSVEGMEDAEADLAERVRAVVGRDCFVAASFDLHGNLSRLLADQLDHLTCYRMAPHEDEDNTRMRLCHSLLSRLRGERGSDPDRRRPFKALVNVPILLPGEKTSTRLEPARSLYGALPAIEALAGVEDASIWIGYAWADQPRCHAVVGVVGDDAFLCAKEAEHLANCMWRQRRRFAFGTQTRSIDECLDQACSSMANLDGPFIISDSGDNPTAGGAGDVSWTLSRVLMHPLAKATPAETVYASIPDEAAVQICAQAGLAARVTLDVGAKVDAGHGGPARLEGEIVALASDPVGGACAVVRRGGVRVILTSRRKPYHRKEDFALLGIDLAALDVLIVKIGYLEPELHDAAAHWMLALTPGAVDQDLVRLGHQHLERPIFPFDDDIANPPLKARLSRGPYPC